MRSVNSRRRNIAGGKRSVRWRLGENAGRRVTRESAILIVLAALCIAGAIFGNGAPERVALAALAIGMTANAFRKLSARARAAREAGFVSLDDRGIVRRQAGSNVVLASWSAPFGVSLFASKAGDRGLIAFTSDGATRYLGVHVPESEAPEAASLFDRSAVHADDDALFAQGVDTSLRASSAAELLSAVAGREPDALERVFLTSARGEPVVVGQGLLKVADREFDLRAPLDWRPFLFHEVAGQVTTIYQATWLKQEQDDRTNEIVLVAPLPATSEVRLSPSLSDAPPSREMRVAIERLFMPILRRVLERSPRASRTSAPPVRRVAKAKGGASSGA